MGRAIEYSRRMNLARTTPKKELASTGYCLAEPGVAYLVFAPEGGEIEVDLASDEGPFSVEWHNAITGEVVEAPPVPGGIKQTFRAPFAGAAVLFLKNES